METKYFLVNVETVLAFDFQIIEECEGVQSLYDLDIDGKPYWLIAATNTHQLLKALFNKPENYIKYVKENKDIYDVSYFIDFVKKYAIGLIKPEYYEISENFAKAIIIEAEFN